MTNDDKLAQMQRQLGSEEDSEILNDYLLQAKSLILNTRFPYGYDYGTEVEPKYEQLHIELAIVLFNERGAEGQSSHNENGVNRSWRTKGEILAEITPMAGVL